MNKVRVALAALSAVTMTSFVMPAQAQQICLNPSVPTSLTDQTTENDSAKLRVQALGNRCVKSNLTGRQVTTNTVERFLNTNPDQRDNVPYGRLVSPR